MDSDEEDVSYEEEDDSDSASECPDGDEGFDSNYDASNQGNITDDFTYEVLTPDTIVSYMNAIIDEVNAVFQVGQLPLSLLLVIDNAYIIMLLVNLL